MSASTVLVCSSFSSSFTAYLFIGLLSSWCKGALLGFASNINTSCGPSFLDRVIITQVEFDGFEFCECFVFGMGFISGLAVRMAS